VKRSTGRLTIRLAVTLGAGLLAFHAAHAEPPSWPAENPRVRLERVFELDDWQSGRGGRMLRWLTGEESSRRRVVRRPYGVAWDGKDLLVTDPDSGRVLRLPHRGRRRSTRPDAIESPLGVAVCRRGIVVTDSTTGRVALLDAKLRRVAWLAEGFERPTGVACHDGQIYVVETGAHRLRILGPDGEWRSLGGRGEAAGSFNFPTAITLDGDELWVGDALNFRVQRVAADSGEALTAFGELGDAPGEMPRLKGLAIDAAGHLWISDAHLDRVGLFATDGTFLMSLGRSGSAPGEFLFPAGVAADGEGRVAVVDSYNRRVQVFRLLEPAKPATKR